MVRRILAAVIAALLAAPAVLPAQAQRASLPANTVWGRLGISPGPGEAIPFATLFSSAHVQPVTANLTALLALGSTGFPTRTGTDTWAQRLIAGTAAEVTVTNGNGVSGNPTISLPASITLTGKTLTGGTFNSGAFNGTLGATTPATIAGTTGSFTGNLSVGGTGASPGYNAATRALGIIGDGTASNFATGALYLQNNRAAPASGDVAGQIDFLSANNLGRIGAASMGTLLTGSGGGNGFGGDITFYTKPDNTNSLPERMRITSAGNVTIGASSATAQLQNTGSVLFGSAGGAFQTGNIGINGVSGCLTSDGAAPATITAGSCGTGLPGGGSVGQELGNTASGTGNWRNTAYFNVKDVAATDCTGVAATVLSTVIGSNKSIVIPPGCTIKVSANDTIARGVNIFIPNGALISVDNTKTLTIHGTIQAGPYKIFTGAGVVTAIADVLPEWWDARNDATTDDILALRAAWTSSFASSASDGKPRITLSPGSCYKVTDQWTIAPTFTSSPEIAGAGSNRTRICASTTFSATSILQVDGQTPDGTTEVSNLHIHDFGIISLNGTATGTTARCFSMGTANKQIQGTNNSRIYGMLYDGCARGVYLGNTRIITFSDIRINLPHINNAVGLQFDPLDTTLFTSDMQFRDIQIVPDATATGQFDIYYRATAGTTGIAGIKVDGAQLYGAPGAGGAHVKILCDGANVADIFHYGRTQYDGPGGPAAAIDILNVGTGECYDLHFTDNYFQGITGAGVQINAATPDDIYDIIVTSSFFRGITREALSATNTNNVIFSNNVHTGAPSGATRFVFLNSTYATVLSSLAANSASAVSAFVDGNGTATNTGCTNLRVASAVTTLVVNMGGATNDCAGAGVNANRP